jgi:hypothetical protein
MCKVEGYKTQNSAVQTLNLVRILSGSVFIISCGAKNANLAENRAVYQLERVLAGHLSCNQLIFHTT